MFLYLLSFVYTYAKSYIRTNHVVNQNNYVKCIQIISVSYKIFVPINRTLL